MDKILNPEVLEERARNLGARNGTLVNGSFIDQCGITAGDEIRVGDGFFKFIERDCDGYLSYRIDGAVFDSAPATPSWTESVSVTRAPVSARRSALWSCGRPKANSSGFRSW